MLGFGALGQLALGQQPLQDGIVFNPEGAGSGAAYWRFKFAPEPPFDAKPNKPFRPVWDRPRGEVEEPTAAAAPPVPIPLPPPSIFAQPVPSALPPVSGAAPFGLPDFNDLVPPDPVGLGQRMQEAQDMQDALAVLAALSTAGKAN